MELFDPQTKQRDKQDKQAKQGQLLVNKYCFLPVGTTCNREDRCYLCTLRDLTRDEELSSDQLYS